MFYYYIYIQGGMRHVGHRHAGHAKRLTTLRAKRRDNSVVYGALASKCIESARAANIPCVYRSQPSHWSGFESQVRQSKGAPAMNIACGASSRDGLDSRLGFNSAQRGAARCVGMAARGQGGGGGSGHTHCDSGARCSEVVIGAR